eukprot:TRINITY_DN12909_c0_g1_i2.p1 TRINITY_DN12909_c0_g1~~TRINITY_DN12909_c0_g1_i2.p1  ORF type:complete len:222 (+),score=18.28 TRINITY_DN12909_c0_g1_i2:210-875(+)
MEATLLAPRISTEMEAVAGLATRSVNSFLFSSFWNKRRRFKFRVLEIEQVRCTEKGLCKEDGVNVVVTDVGRANDAEFILTNHAFSAMAVSADADSFLVAKGIVNIQYRRISCQYAGRNLAIKIDESSNFPSYLAVQFWYQAGKKDITAVDFCENANLECKLGRRSHGAVWDVVRPPSGDLSVRVLVSEGEDDEQWVTATNLIPSNWTAGALYDSGIQLQE